MAGLGLFTVFSAGAKAGRAAERGLREATRIGQIALSALVAGGLIATVQWFVLARGAGGSPVVFGLVFGLPALLAGTTVARVLAVSILLHRSYGPHLRRGGRGVRR